MKSKPGVFALLGHFLGMAESRLELFLAEWQREKSRFALLIACLCLGIGSALLAAVGLILTAILLTPDEHRWITASVCTLVLAVSAAICAFVVVRLTVRGGRPFLETTDELKKDALCLKELVKSRKSHS